MGHLAGYRSDGLPLAMVSVPAFFFREIDGEVRPLIYGLQVTLYVAAGA